MHSTQPQLYIFGQFRLARCYRQSDLLKQLITVINEKLLPVDNFVACVIDVHMVVADEEVTYEHLLSCFKFNLFLYPFVICFFSLVYCIFIAYFISFIILLPDILSRSCQVTVLLYAVNVCKHFFQILFVVDICLPDIAIILKGCNHVSFFPSAFVFFYHMWLNN